MAGCHWGLVHNMQAGDVKMAVACPALGFEAAWLEMRLRRVTRCGQQEQHSCTVYRV